MPAKERVTTMNPLPLTDPLTREAMAKWIENFYVKYHDLIAKEAAWLSQHPDDKESRGRLNYYRNALSVTKQLAYIIRTQKTARLP